MRIKNILKDHNYESPDSTLKVKYIASYGNSKTQKYIHINPSLFKINPYTPKIRYKINDLRKEQFNSFSNENMDFFRLDHLSECDRSNYHNKFMDNIKPVNRSANFDKFNDLAKNIKYLDYLKQNYLLNQNKTINSNIVSERDLEIAEKRENYYTNKTKILPKINSINLKVNKAATEETRNNNNDDIHSYNFYNNNFNTINRNISNPYKKEMTKSNSALEITGKYLNNNINYNYNYNDTINNNRNNNCKKVNQSYSNSYLSNINDYSIKEGDINLYEDKTRLKLYPTFQRDTIDKEKFRELYNQENYRTLINNNPFYMAYNENCKNGFLKKNGDFSNYDKLYKNKFFFRNNNNIYDEKRNHFNSFFRGPNVQNSFSYNKY